MTRLHLVISGVMAALSLPASVDAQRPPCGTRSTAACTAPGLTFRDVSSGLTHSCGVTSGGAVYCWGDGRKGALGDGRLQISRLPQRVMSDLPFVDVAAGGNFSCARTFDGRVLCWGNERPVPGWPEIPDSPRVVDLPRPASTLTVGRRHACVLDGDGRAYCWGWNVDGETGTGSSGLGAAMVAVPTPVAADVRFSHISAGLGFTCAVSTDAGVYCWGSNVDQVMSAFNASERCGDVHPIACASRPVSVPFPARASRISVGTSHVCALTDTGRIYCWGSNGAGQVGAHGPGVPVVRAPSEVVISRSGPFTDVSSGGIHTCALTASRRVYCWGAYDHYGDDRAGAEALVPTLAAGGTLFQSISAGQIHACGLDAQGRVLCWGDTIHGALGVR